MSVHSHLYKTKRWQKQRKAHLAGEPLCRMCAKAGKVVAADVADHVRPHKGDMTLFLDPANLQSLCYWHHNKVKQREEWLDAQVPRVDLDGYPIDGKW